MSMGQGQDEGGAKGKGADDDDDERRTVAFERFDRDIVRALLDCVALCPVGSYVKLSNGKTARVLRSNGAEHTRPIVVPLREDGTESDQVFDLSKDDWIRIVAAVDGPDEAQAA